MSYNFTPTNANALTVIYGIEDTLATDDSAWILQDVNVTTDINSIQIPDQRGRIAQVRDRKKHWSVSFTAIGPEPTTDGDDADTPFKLGTSYTFSGITGVIMSVEKRSTYNDTAKWSVTMDCYEDASYKVLTESTGS